MGIRVFLFNILCNDFCIVDLAQTQGMSDVLCRLLWDYEIEDGLG